MYTTRSEADFAKWRRLIIKTAYCIAVIVLIAEASLVVLTGPAEIQLGSIANQLFRFLVIPTTLNFAVIAIGTKLLTKKGLDESKKNFITCMILYLVCALSQIVHYNLMPMYCSTIVAIFATIIFANPRFTRIIFILSLCSISIAFCFSAFEQPTYMPHYNIYKVLMEYFCAVVITVCSFITANALIRFESEREKKVVDSYKKQIELLNQVKLDSNTGLLNRRAIIEKADRSFGKRQFTKDIQLILIEIDNYDNLREKVGRENSDQLIEHIALIIKEVFNSEACTASRYDLDQFAVLVRGESEQYTMQRLEKLKLKASLMLVDGMKSDFVSLSYAVSVYTQDMWSSSDLFTRAEKLLAGERTLKQMDSFKV